MRNKEPSVHAVDGLMIVRQGDRQHLTWYKLPAYKLRFNLRFRHTQNRHLGGIYNRDKAGATNGAQA